MLERSRYVHRARNASLLVAGGGLAMAAAYFGQAGLLYLIAWLPLLVGGVVALRALVLYLRAGGGRSAILALTLLLLVVGGGSAGTTVEAQREWQVASAAFQRTMPLASEAVDAVAVVLARQTPWGAADVQDMYRAADLYERAARELASTPAPVLRTAGWARYWWVDALSTAYAQRADFARRIALAVTETRREELFREWERQDALDRWLADEIRRRGR